MKPKIRLSKLWIRTRDRSPGSLAWGNKWVCWVPTDKGFFRNGFGPTPTMAYAEWRKKYGVDET